MSRMSKKISYKLSLFLLYFIFSFNSVSQSAEKVYNIKIENWIEGIPILKSLVENKRDVVEFDSSNGKIISISFNSKSLQKKQIISFYKGFFEDKKWEKHKDKNVWEIKRERFNKKTFKIENIEDNHLTIKIIIENF